MRRDSRAPRRNCDLLIQTCDDPRRVATCNGRGVRVDRIHQQLHFGGFAASTLPGKIVRDYQAGVEVAFADSPAQVVG